MCVCIYIHIPWASKPAKLKGVDTKIPDVSCKTLGMFNPFWKYGLVPVKYGFSAGQIRVSEPKPEVSPKNLRSSSTCGNTRGFFLHQWNSTGVGASVGMGMNHFFFGRSFHGNSWVRSGPQGLIQFWLVPKWNYVILFRSLMLWHYGCPIIFQTGHTI